MIALAPFLIGLLAACEPPLPEPEPEPEPVIPTIELVSPEDGISIELKKDDEISFEWKKAEGINNYKLCLSLKPDMSDPHTVAALANPLLFTGKEFDNALSNLDFPEEAQKDVYWSIIPFSARTQAETQVRKMTVKRLVANAEDIGRNADTLIHKIGIYYEDMYVNTSDGRKRLHEACHWNNPWKQSQDLAKYMTECSHGVVQYQIVVEIDGEVPYAYYYEDREDDGHFKGDIVTAQQCYEEFWSNGRYPGIGEGVQYDYSKMITDNKFDEMMNDGTIDEVWVYNHPGAGMYETCMAGPSAFWINGSTFSVPTLKRQCTVLFANYERTVDLAMHSLAHKFENVMKKVYDGHWAYNATREGELNNWERFSGYKYNYGKYIENSGHIGNCHFPCNAYDEDKCNYGYSVREYVYSYCDSWATYPKVPLEDPRYINCKEWGSDQMGYMKWFYSHVPHFAGINEADYHLNNWWYYFIDYTKAKEYENRLRREL